MLTKRDDWYRIILVYETSQSKSIGDSAPDLHVIAESERQYWRYLSSTTTIKVFPLCCPTTGKLQAAAIASLEGKVSSGQSLGSPESMIILFVSIAFIHPFTVRRLRICSSKTKYNPSTEPMPLRPIPAYHAPLYPRSKSSLPRFTCASTVPPIPNPIEIE